MKKHISILIKKITYFIILLFAVSITAFLLVSSSPLDPLKTNIGQTALGGMSKEQIEKLEEYWGVHTPLTEKYLQWAKDFIHGDMGTSLLYRKPVSKVIWEKFSNSCLLLLFAWIISGTIGFFLGILAGINQGKRIDKWIKGYAFLISSMPVFWIALLFLMIFSVWLGILPIGFSVPIGVEAEFVTIKERIIHAVLPAFTLSITGIANITLHTREKMIEVMETDYVLFAKARGETTFGILKHHGIRNILSPVISLQFASISEIFGGSILVEEVFSYPGLGKTIIEAGLGSDIPLLLGITMISASIVFGGNLIANFLYEIIDPRIQRGRKGE